jgi:hypothetical protein
MLKAILQTTSKNYPKSWCIIKILGRWRMKSYFVWKVQFKSPIIDNNYQGVSTLILLHFSWSVLSKSRVNSLNRTSWRVTHTWASRIVLGIVGEEDRRRIGVLSRKIVGTARVPICYEREDPRMSSGSDFGPNYEIENPVFSNHETLRLASSE